MDMQVASNLQPSSGALAHPMSNGSQLPEALNALLADILATYIKTKAFHWHMSGPHFRDYHLLLDEQATQIFAMVDVLAERVRKLGSPTLRSIGHVVRLQRLRDNDSDRVAPADMLAELARDNVALVGEMRSAHALCEQRGDLATASVLETFIDEGERRVWFLAETAGSDAFSPPIGE